jgi:hypothetical protein
MKGLFAGAVIAMAALVAAGSVQASTPSTPLTISGQTIFANGFGTFTTSAGSGVCATGITTDTSLGAMFVTGGHSGNHINFHDLKTFTCDDGTGTFTADLQVMLAFGSPADSFRWNIISGTGAYTNLHGTGSGVGLQLPGEVDDTYTGSVHFN